MGQDLVQSYYNMVI